MSRDKRHVVEAPNGEIMTVSSLEGHEDCTVLGECTGEVPEDHRWSRSQKRFVVDDKRTEARAKERDQSHAGMRRRIEELERRLALLEQSITGE